MIEAKPKATYKKPLPKCQCCKDRFSPFFNNGLQKFCMKKDQCVTAHTEWMKSEQGRKAKKVVDKKATQKAKVENLSNDGYRKKYVQPIINEIARIIDYGLSCTATGNYGKEQGGHYIGTGANRTLTYNLHNIHIQSFESNHHKSGDPIKYRAGIVERYGNSYIEFMESLQGFPALHLSKVDLVALKEKASFIRLNLKRDLKQRSAAERIELRNWVNQQLGLYPIEFSEFKTD